MVFDPDKWLQSNAAQDISTPAVAEPAGIEPDQPAFDPDAYLSEQTPVAPQQQERPTFDPDAFLAAQPAPVEPEPSAQAKSFRERLGNLGKRVTDVGRSFGAGSLELLAGGLKTSHEVLTGGVGKAAIMSIAKRFGVPEETLAFVNQPQIADLVNLPAKKLSKAAFRAAEVIAPELKNTQGIVANIKKKNYGEAGWQAGNAMARSLPQILALVASGGTAGVGFLGAAAAGQKLEQLETERPGMDPLVARANAAATGIVEALSERIGSGRLVKRIMGGSAFRNGVRGAITEVLRDAGIEGGEEMAAQIGGNLVDMLTGVKRVKDLRGGVAGLFEGVPDAVIVGTLMGGGLGAAASMTARAQPTAPTTPTAEGALPPPVPAQPPAIPEADVAETAEKPIEQMTLEAETPSTPRSPNVNRIRIEKTRSTPSHAEINGVKPDAKVRVYRATIIGGQIEPGDFVTQDREVAKFYARDIVGQRGDATVAKIVSKTVRADEMRRHPDHAASGVWNEFIYNPSTSQGDSATQTAQPPPIPEQAAVEPPPIPPQPPPVPPPPIPPPPIPAAAQRVELDMEKQRTVPRSRQEALEMLQTSADPIQRLIAARIIHKKALPETKRLRHEVRIQQSAAIESAQRQMEGTPGLIAAMRVTKGEMPLAEREDVGRYFTTAEREAMITAAQRAYDTLKPFQRRNAATAIQRMMGGLPLRSFEDALLAKVFGPQFAKAAQQGGSTAKAMNAFIEVTGILRTLKTMLDLSALGRQGAMLSVRNPREYARAINTMSKGLFNEKNYQRLHDAMTSDPRHDLREESGLYLAPADKAGVALTEREEAFMSKLAERIPGVRISERAFNGFLNALRTDVFDKFADKWGDKATQDDYNKLAAFINTATGRGDLKGLGRQGESLEKAMPAAAIVFFSPRFVLSRIQAPLRAITPIRDSETGKLRWSPANTMAIQSLASYYGLVTTAIWLAGLAGAKTEKDPRSSDFGKIRIGNTRIDLTAGLGPYIRNTAQILSGFRKNVDTGKLTKVQREHLMWRFIRSKFSPAAGIIWDAISGKTFIGDSFVPIGDEDTAMALAKYARQAGFGDTVARRIGQTGEITQRELMPLIIQQTIEGIQADGLMGGLLSGSSEAIGVSASSFKPRTTKRRTRTRAQRRTR